MHLENGHASLVEIAGRHGEQPRFFFVALLAFFQLLRILLRAQIVHGSSSKFCAQHTERLSASFPLRLARPGIFIALLREGRKSKISDLDHAIAAHHEVCRLEILGQHEQRGQTYMQRG